jgi:hypothetical protein
MRLAIIQTLAFVIVLSATGVLASETKADVASSCNAVRVDLPGGSLFSLPNYFQGKTALCYAYASAEMIDAYRATRLGGTKNMFISPAHVGAIYSATETVRQQLNNLDIQLQKKEISPVAFEILKKITLRRAYDPDDGDASDPGFILGQISEALKDALKRKVLCSSAIFQGRDSQVEQRLVPLMELRREIIRSSGDRQAYIGRMGQELEKVFQTKIKDVANRSNVILQAVDNKYDYVLAIIESACDEKIDVSDVPVPQEKLYGDTTIKTPGFQTDILQLLNTTQPLPIGVSFDGAILTKPGVMHYGHAAIIIGKEIKDGVCQLIIRDTLGCERSEWEKLKYSCVDGQIWVPIDEFAKSVTRITWF